jgi:hypothetical protein
MGDIGVQVAHYDVLAAGDRADDVARLTVPDPGGPGPVPVPEPVPSPDPGPTPEPLPTPPSEPAA